VRPFSVQKGHPLVTCTLRFLRSWNIAEEQDSLEDWFLVEQGLKTVSAPIMGRQKRRIDLRAIQELREFQKVLQVAMENKVGWHLAVDF
jgi:hypothetical protein